MKGRLVRMTFYRFSKITYLMEVKNLYITSAVYISEFIEERRLWYIFFSITMKNKL